MGAPRKHAITCMLLILCFRDHGFCRKRCFKEELTRESLPCSCPTFQHKMSALTKVRLKIQMRSVRRPLTAKAENAVDLSPPPNKSAKELHHLLASLSDFMQKFQAIDQAIFSIASDLGAMSQEVAVSKQTRSVVLELEQRFQKMNSELATAIDKVNSADLVQLTTNAFDKFSYILSKVNANPPSMPALGKEHRSAYKSITETVVAAKAAFANEDMEGMRQQLGTLKHDLSHQYDAFFRLSQIDKAWRVTIVDECRQLIDKIISLSKLWNVGHVEVPAVAEDIVHAFESWKEEVATAPKRRSPSASLIPRPSPFKTIASGERKLLERTEKEDSVVRKTGRIPVSTRSKSATRYEMKRSVSDTDAGTRQPRTPGSETKVRQSRITPPRARKSVAELERTLPSKVVPLHKSPKIDLSVATDESSSDDEFIQPSRDMMFQSPILNRLATDLAEIQAESSPSQGEWSAMEARFTKYVTAIGTNDLFSSLLNALRSIGKRPSHANMATIRAVTQEIEQKVLVTKPLFEVEQRLEEVTYAVAGFVKQLGDDEESPLRRLLIDIQSRLDTIKKTCERAAWDTELNELRVELLRLQEASQKFEATVTREAEVRQISAENAQLRKQVQCLNITHETNTAEQRDKVCSEMKAVQSRIAALRDERNCGNELTEADAQELEAEFEALLEQQMGLVNALASLKS